MDLALMGDPNMPTDADYLRVLSAMPRYGERGFHSHDDGGLRGHFADGGSEENGLRTNGSYLFTTALLASDPGYDAAIGGVSQDQLLARARAVLCYMLDGHRTGSGTCADGQQWGGAWQSAWWTTKMAQGAQLIWDELDEAEQAGVERVVSFEAERHAGRIVPTGLTGDTKAEENAWDAEILATAQSLFPDHGRAAAWRSQLVEHAFNTLSVSQDRFDARVVEGRVVRDAVYSVNLYSDFMLDNHGSAHFCYIASPLASIAWSYHALRRAGQPVPEALFHHVQDLWTAAKPLFLGNRFAYIAGKDWARYTYGQYFIVPALVMLQDRYADGDARSMEAARFAALAEEQQHNDDGSFFGERVTHNEFFGQSAKYETDCYAMLGLAYRLRRDLQPEVAPSTPERLAEGVYRTHVSPESHTCYAHTPEVFASFSMRSLTSDWPMALFIPAGMDDLAEWAESNLMGEVKLWQEPHAVTITQMRQQSAGFHVQATLCYRAAGHEQFVHELDYAFDAERAQARIHSRFVARRRVMIGVCRGLNLHVVNDRFNGSQRTYEFDGGRHVARFDPAARAGLLPRRAPSIAHRLSRGLARVSDVGSKVTRTPSRWLNIDGRLGIIQLDGRRGFAIRETDGREACGVNWNQVFTDDGRGRPFRAEPDEVLLDTRVLLHCGDASATSALAVEQS